MLENVEEWDAKLLKQNPQIISPEDPLLLKAKVDDRFTVTDGVGIKATTDIGQVELKFLWKEELYVGFLVHAISKGDVAILFEKERVVTFILFFSEGEIEEFDRRPWLLLDSHDKYPENHAVLIITQSDEELHVHHGPAMEYLRESLAV